MQQIHRTPTATYQMHDIIRSSVETKLISASRGETNHQQDSSKSHHTQPSNRGSEFKPEKKDIKKFYEDLVKNVSLTQIDEMRNENGSETINDTNLSNLYQRVMN